MDILEIAMGLIATAGDAKSYAIEAIAKSREFDFAAAKQLIEKANEALIKAHEVQTDLIRREMTGDGEAVRLIMVHAQDHVMGAIHTRDMAEEFIALYETIKKLTHKHL